MPTWVMGLVGYGCRWRPFDLGLLETVVAVGELIGIEVETIELYLK